MNARVNDIVPTSRTFHRSPVGNRVKRHCDICCKYVSISLWCDSKKCERGHRGTRLIRERWAQPGSSCRAPWLRVATKRRSHRLRALPHDCVCKHIVQRKARASRACQLMSAMLIVSGVNFGHMPDFVGPEPPRRRPPGYRRLPPQRNRRINAGTSPSSSTPCPTATNTQRSPATR